jgi:hypothetical protein
MPSAREDYLLRTIQRLAAVLARLRERLTGPTAVLDAPEVEREAAAAIVSLLGPQSSVLQQVDSTSAVRLVADRDRVALWTALMRVQADALRLQGRTESAERLSARAAALENAARAVWH